MRCEGRQSEGTGYSSGRLRASAFTFLAPGTCETSKVMRRIEASSAICSSTRPKGCFVENILLRPDSAPVLSQSEGRQRGTLQQGASAERPRISPACARASQLAISLARSLPKGMPTSSKSETEKDSENQTCPREGLETKPPRQQWRPLAEASAKASTSACGEGRMLASGGTYWSQRSKACSAWVEADDNLRRELLRHSMRSHRRLWVTATFERSARQSSGT